MIPRGVHRYAQQTFEVIDEPRVELEEIIDAEDGETIVTVQRALGRARHTRLKVDFRWAAVWTVRGGKVVCAQGYRKLGFCFHAREHFARLLPQPHGFQGVGLAERAPWLVAGARFVSRYHPTRIREVVRHSR